MSAPPPAVYELEREGGEPVRYLREDLAHLREGRIKQRLREAQVLLAAVLAGEAVPHARCIMPDSEWTQRALALMPVREQE